MMPLPGTVGTASSRGNKGSVLEDQGVELAAARPQASSCFKPLGALLLQQLLQAVEHRLPVLLGVLARLVAGVVVLRKRDEGLRSLPGKLDGHGVVIFRRVRKAGKRAVVAVPQQRTWLDFQDQGSVSVASGSKLSVTVGPAELSDSAGFLGGGTVEFGA